MDGFTIFKTEQNGFDREQVKEYCAGLHRENEKLRKQNRSLVAKNKKLEEQIASLSRTEAV